MTKILTPEELNEVKLKAESLGFEGRVLTNYAVFRKKFNELSMIQVSYDVVNGIPYTEIHSGSLSLVADEVDEFEKILMQAQEIARTLAGDE